MTLDLHFSMKQDMAAMRRFSCWVESWLLNLNMGTFRKGLFNPLVKAHSGSLRGSNDIGMQMRRNSHIESSGKSLVGSNPTLLACLQVHFKGGSPLTYQTLYIGSVKVGTPGKANELPTKHANVGIKSNHGFVFINFRTFGAVSRLDSKQ